MTGIGGLTTMAGRARSREGRQGPVPDIGENTADEGQELDVPLLKRVIAVQTGVARLGMDFEAIADLVAREILGMTSADAAIVEMLEGDELVYLAASGSAADSVGLRLSLATSLSGVCVTQARTLYCEDAHSDPRVDRDACDRVGLRSMVVAPLIHRGTAVGVLKILSPRPTAFDWRDRKVLTYMAEVIAASIHTASRYAEDVLFRKATRDHLTGLANRALFHDRLEHGHQAGDVALRTLAARLAAGARRSDTVARLGGDEFVIVLSPLQDRATGEEIVARMQTSLRERLVIGGESQVLSASFGLALYPEDGISADQLLEAADRAMYRAKRNRVRESR